MALYRCPERGGRRVGGREGRRERRSWERSRGSRLRAHAGAAVLPGASLLAGTPAALSLIFLSEIGDKTFFIAALLAAKRGRAAVLAGSMGALSLMTAISVGIGAALNYLPSSLTAYRPLTTQLAALLLCAFGAKSIRESLQSFPSADNGELSEAERVVASTTSTGTTSPSASAGGAELTQNAVRGYRLTAIAEAFSLTFAAEWGDRSMLSTVALGATRGPLGVFIGATGGHAIATLLAVLSGYLLSKRVSSRAMSLASGCLFVTLGICTASNWL